MFLSVTLIYPVVLAALCVGAGLLVDRVSGGFLPGMLLPAVGLAALIGVSQLTTYDGSTAPATPYVLAGVAVAGFGLGWRRARGLARGWRAHRWQLVTPVAAYLLALAPVLLAGRLTFSSYGVLPDSALHMMGADYMLHHGQSYAHLDLRNSYGLYLSSYFDTGYPSGSDALFGGTAFLLGLPLIWAFQPFTAFVLATATGPAWLLARRLGLDGVWAVLAALTVTVPALVYGYELVASIKEIVALSLILTLGVLVVLHPRWLRLGPAAALPFALVVAAGVSALGVAFGAWALAAAAVLGAFLVGDVSAGRLPARRALALVGAGVLVAIVAAWPTWTDLGGALQTATGIATTGNPGNLSKPLRPEQMFGTWLGASYRNTPRGLLFPLTYAAIAVAFVAAVLGAVHLRRTREVPLLAWLGLTLAAGVALYAYGTTWTEAKTLMLTSPLIVLLAWGGVAALRGSRRRWLAPALAVTLAGGVLLSDAIQYHSSDMAPTVRYREMASLNTRYAARGPTMFTDFDEWALYQLRDLDVGGPNFIYPPPALPRRLHAHSAAVDLDGFRPADLAPYPLIVTRRDPKKSRPPSAYRLASQGSFYQVWERRPNTPAAVAHVSLSGQPIGCARVARLAQLARSSGAQLVAAAVVDIRSVGLRRSSHPGWRFKRGAGLLMTGSGTMRASFTVPHAGRWNLWLQGKIMRAVHLSVDGRPAGSIAEEVSGNESNPDTMAPLPLTLRAGRHRLALTRGGIALAPGDGGAGILHAVFLTPAGAAGQERLSTIAPNRWRSLCGGRFDWLEAVAPA
ncbi:MAG: hypothetical protein QOI91_45 [Solirubrobacteraceae bacterium]|nr:hypothetical protein [Solirubrobacteraceae bacterium]